MEASVKQVRVCQAVGCRKRIGTDLRRRYCSEACAVKMNRLLTRQGQADLHGENRQAKICALEGCNNLVPEDRRRYCSVKCAKEAQREQNRTNPRSNRRINSYLSVNKRYERHIQEIRTIRSMQDVPADRWGEYEFVRG